MRGRWIEAENMDFLYVRLWTLAWTTGSCFSIRSPILFLGFSYLHLLYEGGNEGGMGGRVSKADRRGEDRFSISRDQNLGYVSLWERSRAIFNSKLGPNCTKGSFLLTSVYAELMGTQFSLHASLRSCKVALKGMSLVFRLAPHYINPSIPNPVFIKPC